MNALLRSARIIDENSKYHGHTRDILIEKGVISAIAATLDLPKNCKEVKLKNLHVSKGWFDSSVSFGEPGYEERETIDNGLKTAALSGFTKVAVNPNTNPVIDNKSQVEFLIQKGASSAVRLFPLGNLTQGGRGKELAELYDMQRSGAVAFVDYGSGISNANLLKIALLYAQNFEGLIMSFPQDMSIGTHGFVNESAETTRLGLNSVPNLSEELQITRDLYILQYTGGRLHIPTISTEGAVKLIRDAKRKGLDVTCSVAAHHLSLTDKEIASFDTNFKVNPPLRTEKDVKALLKGVSDGTIDMIVSDHNPIDVENKKVEFENGLYGTTGLESLFGSVSGSVKIETLVKCLTENPCKIFGVEMSTIQEGEVADLTLFDPDLEYEFSERDILSKSKNSAFIGKKMKGKAYGIYSANKLVIE
jgi:dihydroorotase